MPTIFKQLKKIFENEDMLYLFFSLEFLSDRRALYPTWTKVKDRIHTGPRHSTLVCLKKVGRASMTLMSLYQSCVGSCLIGYVIVPVYLLHNNELCCVVSIGFETYQCFDFSDSSMCSLCSSSTHKQGNMANMVRYRVSYTISFYRVAVFRHCGKITTSRPRTKLRHLW